MVTVYSISYRSVHQSAATYVQGAAARAATLAPRCPAAVLQYWAAVLDSVLPAVGSTSSIVTNVQSQIFTKFIIGGGLPAPSHQPKSADVIILYTDYRTGLGCGGPMGPSSGAFMKNFSSLAIICFPYVYLRSEPMCGRILCMRTLR